MENLRDISKLPVMSKRCESCPFNDDGCKSIRQMVMDRSLEMSQTCHSTGVVHGKEDTHLCRGARDYQIELMYRLGVIESPTDEAWDKKRKAVGI